MNVTSRAASRLKKKYICCNIAGYNNNFHNMISVMSRMRHCSLHVNNDFQS